MFRRFELTALAYLTVAASAGLAQAQEGPSGRGMGSVSSEERAGYPSTGQPALGAGVYDLTTIYGEAAGARAEESRAYSDLNMTIIRLKYSFENGPDFKAALQELDAAHDALDSARKTVLDHLSTNQDYQDLMHKHDTIAEVLSEGNLPPRDVVDLAVKKMQYGTSARKMESDALNNDSAVQSARTRLVSAQQKVSDLRSNFEANLYQNPQWAAAKQSYDNAVVASAATAGAQVGAQLTAGIAADADSRRSMYGFYNSNAYGDPYYTNANTYGRP